MTFNNSQIDMHRKYRYHTSHFDTKALEWGTSEKIPRFCNNTGLLSIKLYIHAEWICEQLQTKRGFQFQYLSGMKVDYLKKT